LFRLRASAVIASSQVIQSEKRNENIFGKGSTMTLGKALYAATIRTTGGHENGADGGRLDIKLSPAALSSTLSLTPNWKKWYRVLRYRKGFGLFDSVRFGLWLARSEA
jgi:hypothetical protein